LPSIEVMLRKKFCQKGIRLVVNPGKTESTDQPYSVSMRHTSLWIKFLPYCVTSAVVVFITNVAVIFSSSWFVYDYAVLLFG
jgi:hypothetical protein